MGQYHVLANVDSKEWVDPHRLGLLSKQVEHLGAFYGTLADALYLLTMSSPARGSGDLPETGVSGRWVGQRVCVLGDYTVDADIPGVPDAGSLYERLEEPEAGWVDISAMVADAMQIAFGVSLTAETRSITSAKDQSTREWTSWTRI